MAKRRIIIEIDDEVVAVKHREYGPGEELTGLCLYCMPRGGWPHDDGAHITEMLTEMGVTIISDEIIDEV